jgi:hypothetical protein
LAIFVEKNEEKFENSKKNVNNKNIAKNLK